MVLVWIYIPLCFYFIGYIRAKLSVAIAFTFHYASTLSLVKMSPQGFRLYLHSTMLLLYPDNAVPVTAPNYHLHSTMLLLYRRRVRTTFLLRSTFTFHYASTLSKSCREWEEKRLFYLHSTMLLLYRRHGNIVSSRSCIYIPLCFYFIKTCK